MSPKEGTVVTKTTAEVINVRDPKGSASFFIIQKTIPCSTDPQKPYHGGDLLVHSDFGTYGYSWVHCGEPLKQFLQHCGKHYLVMKLLEGARLEFDSENTTKALLEDIIYRRKQQEISKIGARTLFTRVKEMGYESFRTCEEWVTAIQDIQDSLIPSVQNNLSEILSEPWEYSMQRPSIEAEVFRDIFIPALQTALASSEA